MPKLSIVIPTLNEEKYLPLLLEDIKNQSCKDYEVIIVDCKSEDQTSQVAKQFEKLIPDLKFYQVDKRNIGFQRNFGVRKSKGEWIIFMDADNRLDFDFLEKIMKYILELKNPSFITTGVYIDKKNWFSFILSIYINVGLFIFPKLGFPWLIGAFIAIRKSDFTMVDGFNQDNHPGEDYVFAKKAVRKGLKHICLFDPRYYFSFRRIAKYGFVKSLWNYSFGGTKNYSIWLNNRKW